MYNYLRRKDNDLWPENFWGNLFDSKNYRLMKSDIIENENNYEVEVDLPGFKKENVEINYEKGYLTISAKSVKEEDNKYKYVKRERCYGEIERSYYFGDDVDESKITAKYENGVLTVTVPKKEIKETPKKQITIE